MKKDWIVPTENGTLAVSATYTLWLGKLHVRVGTDDFILPPKFLTLLFGRRESFVVDDKLAFLVIRPFGEADLVIDGKYLSTGEAYR